MIHKTAKIHPLAFIHPDADIAENCIVWQFASILANARLGKGVSIGAGTEIGAGSVVENGARISAQVFLPSHSFVGKGAFIGPRTVATDDRHPRANNSQYVAEPPFIQAGASVGAGSVLLPGVKIGVGAMVGAGSIVTKDVPAHSHVRGEPARIKDYSRVKTETNFDIYAENIRERVKTGEPVKIN